MGNKASTAATPGGSQPAARNAPTQPAGLGVDVHHPLQALPLTGSALNRLIRHPGPTPCVEPGDGASQTEPSVRIEQSSLSQSRPGPGDPTLWSTFSQPGESPQAFDEVDCDGNGTLSMAEFEAPCMPCVQP